MSDVWLLCGDCLDILPTLADSSINLIVTDPPYFKVKGDWWDRQWDKPAEFLAWLDQVLAEFYRVLAPNGSLYLFASPRMAARVECLIAERFNVLNQIRWEKPADNSDRRHIAQVVDKELARSWYPSGERIIFAEHYGADGYAKGESGYSAQCDELRGFTFEPLRAYLDGERRRAKVPHRTVIRELGMTGHDSHFFSQIQWKLPLKAQYEQMRDIFSRNNHGGDYLRREYEDLRREYEDLRREYEDLRGEYDYLRREYEDLRRPFSVTADVPYTDVWTFPTVNHYPGKHVCEKPLAMLEHIVTASSRPGDVVLDAFLGSGNAGIAAKKHGRRFVGIDIQQHWVDVAERRIAEAQLQTRMPL